jgi:hypothetical protein
LYDNGVTLCSLAGDNVRFVFGLVLPEVPLLLFGEGIFAVGYGSGGKLTGLELSMNWLMMQEHAHALE